MQPVVFNAGLEQALNLVGTFVFAISGALLAIHKRYDIVGMTVLAEITAIGGGVIRDLILGAVPPAAFTDHVTFLVPLGAVALLFVVYRYIIQSHEQSQEQSQKQSHEQSQKQSHEQSHEESHEQSQEQSREYAHLVQRTRNRLQVALTLRYRSQIQFAVLVFDAAGLAVFCVAGTAKALAYHLGPIEAIALGTLTAVGGGILRDVLANEQPAVLRADSELYAVPAVLGSGVIVVVQYLHLYGSLAAGLAAVFVFVLRMVALRYGWHAPQPTRSSDDEHGSV